MPKSTAEKRAKQIKANGAPEFLDRHVNDGAIDRGRTAGVVVQDMQAAVVPNGGVDGGANAGFLGHIRGDGDTISAGLRDDLCGLFAGSFIDFGHDNFRTFCCHRAGSGTTDACARSGYQGDFAVQP